MPERQLDAPPAPAPRVRAPVAAQDVREASHLPRTNTRFFGREAEQARLLELLSEPGALVTLVGFGGIGKTRLALEVARKIEFATVFWVPLADTPAEDTLWNTVVGYLNRQTQLPPLPPSLPPFRG